MAGDPSLDAPTGGHADPTGPAGRPGPSARTDAAALGAVCAELLDGVRAGRAGAWEAMLDRFGDMVLAVPLEMRLPRADAEDVFQATWLALHRSVPRIREPAALAAWILTTARREALAVVRRRARRREQDHGDEPLAEQASPVLDEADPARVLASIERRRLVHAGLAALSERCRELLHRLYFAADAPSYADIASALAMKVGSIGPTRMRCLAHLAAWIEEREDP